MELILTSQPKVGSIINIKFIDVLDVVSMPEPFEDNNIVLDAIVLVSGKSWNLIEPLPRTGSLEIDNIETEQGWYERPKVAFSINDTSMQMLNNLHELAQGRYLLIVKDGSGDEYLLGDLEQWMSFNYKLNTNKSRAQTQVIDIDFSFS
jgi:hypothetical protein